MTMNKVESSFKDPSGFVFKKDDIFYRAVNPIYKDNYDLLMQSGLYEELVKKGYLVSHCEVELKGFEDAYKIIKPLQIPFITYPYEWSFSQLKDTALLTLKIQMVALKFGMSLKDASAYNIQFIDGKPVFIDTLSFEKYKEGTSWVAYKQFCQHFLAPLLLMSYRDIRLNQLLKTNIDGIPIDLTEALLPNLKKLNPSVFFHIYMHSKFQKKYEDKDIDFKKTTHVSKSQLININKNLQDTINGLKYPAKQSEWGEYYTFTNYTDDAFENKKGIINSFLDTVNPKFLWDLGANNGLFTRIASQRGINSVAFDIDPVACEKNYLTIKRNGEKNLLPVLFDLTNPSPSIGWANCERENISKRAVPDVIMALALIHHIAISNNVPLFDIAKYFSSLSEYLILEFVPKSDSQVEKLLATREDVFPNYNEEGFEEAFSSFYKIVNKVKIEGSERTLYLMKRTKNG